MKLFFKKLKSAKGVSLIELLVAVTIFSILILSATGIFKMVVDGQRNSISAQNVQENIRYAMEKMSKEMRMAQISNTDCYAGATNKVFNTLDDDQVLYFKNQDGACVFYYLYDESIVIDMNFGENLMSEHITPARVKVSNLKFYVEDNPIGSSKSLQPYVTMVMDAKAVGQAIHEQKMKIQMTVSSRDYGGSGGSGASCTPECSGAACGDDDGCGGLCDGSCATGSCVAGVCEVATYVCNGIDPENSTICAGDDTGLIEDTTKTLVSSCTDPIKCEYACSSGYTYSGGSCASNQGTWHCTITTYSPGSCIGTCCGTNPTGPCVDGSICTSHTTGATCTIGEADFTWYTLCQKPVGSPTQFVPAAQTDCQCY